MIINVSKAKTHLSKLVDMAFQGEEIIIAKNNAPLVERVAIDPNRNESLDCLREKL